MTLPSLDDLQGLCPTEEDTRRHWLVGTSNEQPAEVDSSQDGRRLFELYQAAKDENELLEFKNYELLFKIQELEQNQQRISSKLAINSDNNDEDRQRRPRESPLVRRWQRPDGGDDDDDDDDNNNNNNETTKTTSGLDHYNQNNGTGTTLPTLPSLPPPTTNSTCADAAGSAAEKKSPPHLVGRQRRRQQHNGSPLLAALESRIDGAASVQAAAAERDSDPEERQATNSSDGKVGQQADNSRCCRLVAVSKSNQRHELAPTEAATSGRRIGQPARPSAAAAAAAALTQQPPSPPPLYSMASAVESQQTHNYSSNNNSEDDGLLAISCWLNGTRLPRQRRRQQQQQHLLDGLEAAANHLGHENMKHVYDDNDDAVAVDQATRLLRLDYATAGSLAGCARKTNNNSDGGNERQQQQQQQISKSHEHHQHQRAADSMSEPQVSSGGGGSATAAGRCSSSALDASMDSNENHQLIEYNGAVEPVELDSGRRLSEGVAKGATSALELALARQQPQPLQQPQQVLTLVGGAGRVAVTKPATAKVMSADESALLRAAKVDQSEQQQQQRQQQRQLYASCSAKQSAAPDVIGRSSPLQRVRSRSSSPPLSLLSSSPSSSPSLKFELPPNNHHQTAPLAGDEQHHRREYHQHHLHNHRTHSPTNDIYASYTSCHSNSETSSLLSSSSSQSSYQSRHHRIMSASGVAKRAQLGAAATAKTTTNTRLLARSQPDLSGGGGGPQAAARRHQPATGGARIAVPVMGRRSSSIAATSGRLQQHKQQQQVANKSRSSSWTRSKSSLEQVLVGKSKPLSSCSSLPRRAALDTAAASKGAPVNQQQQQQLQEQVKNSPLLSPVVLAGSASQESMVAVGVQQQTKGAAAAAGYQCAHQIMSPSASSALPSSFANAAGARAARVRSSSTSTLSNGFVTQIPTLIGQSHASGLQAASIATPATAAAATTTTGAVSEQPRRMNGVGGSKSMSNLAANESFDAGADYCGDCPGSGADELTTTTTPRRVEEKLSSSERDKTSQSCSLLPTAPRLAARKSSSQATGRLHQQQQLSASCMSVVGETVSATADIEEPTVALSGSRGKEKEEPSSNRSNSLVPTDQQPDRLSSSSSNSSGLAACNNGSPHGEQQLQCSQCKLLQSKLSLLIKDRKQLNEQLSELEEMENDSRLMSQKLAQQTLLLEQQLDACKLELQKTCDNESRLQFQNKRLNFELRQRLESIQQLQCQLSKLQTKAGLAARASEQKNRAAIDAGAAVNGGGGASGPIDSARNDRRERPPPPPVESKAGAAQSATSDSNAALEAGQPKSLLVGAHCSPTTEHCPVQSDEDDVDENAIDVFEKRKKGAADRDVEANTMSMVQQVKEATTGGGNSGGESNSGGSQADDSAYSKSSASSDANSDDGHRSDSEAASPMTLERSDPPANENEASGGGLIGRVAVAVVVSSSSSGDESDHHESNANQNLGPLTSAAAAAVIGPANSEQLVVGQMISGQVLTSLSASASAASSSAAGGLTGRQQVLRKKISTARILRGIQVQQSAAQLVVANGSNSPTVVKFCAPPGQREWPPEEDCPSTSNSPAAAIGQARLTQVVADKDIGGNQDGLVNEADNSDNGDKPDQRSPGANSMDASGSPSRCGKSQFDLLLRGVDEIECGHADEALRSLMIDNSDGPLKELQVATVKMDSVAAAATTTPRQSAIVQRTQDSHSLASHNQLVNQFKEEIAGLKTRLMQAHTLNDNLVAELNSSKERFEQFASHLSAQQAQQQQHQQHLACSNSAPFEPRCEGELPRQRSIIYMNGVRTTVSHQAAVLSFNSSNGSGSSNNNNGGTGNNCCLIGHQYASSNSNQHAACISPDELLGFLRFLLDKVHFHHGRTFELVNECQKLAMNALMASYSHQMNLIHHNSVVLAGNQAATIAASSNLVADRRPPTQLLAPDVGLRQRQPEVAASIGLEAPTSIGEPSSYPVRPPPRRRNAASRMLSASDLQQRLDDQPSGEQAGSKSADQPQPPPPPTVSCGGRGPASAALQVAKQTLFSIVPIYYNSSSPGGGGRSTKNNKAQSKLDAAELCVRSENNLQQQPQPTKANNRSTSPTQASPTMRLAKSKSWLVLSSSSGKQAAASQLQQQQLAAEPNDYQNLNHGASYAHVNSQQQQQQQQNVSILEINRNTAANPIAIGQQALPLSAQQQPSCVAQHLLKVKNSLSEDIERYRVHFNGQLLDLLTRQNWCESIIADKIKAYQQTVGSLSQSRQAQTGSVYASSENRSQIMESIGSNRVASNMTKSANVPVNTISLDPNGQALKQPLASSQLQRQSWPNHGHHQGASSFC